MMHKRLFFLSTTSLAALLGCSELLGIDGFSGEGGSAKVDDRDVGGGGGAGGDTTGGGGAVTASEVWALAFGSAQALDAGRAIAVGGEDEVVVAGTIGKPVDFGGGNVGASSEQLFVSRFGASGEHVASHASSGTATVALAGAALDPAGNVVVAGTFTNGSLKVAANAAELTPPLPNAADVFVAKLDATGAAQWSLQLAADNVPSVQGIAVDASDGAVVIAGGLRGTLDLGSQVLSAEGGDDAFVARFRSTGQLEWAARFGDGNSQVAQAVAITPSGTIWLGGAFQGGIQLGDDVHGSVGQSDLFLARLSPAGAVQASARFGDGAAHRVGAITADDDGLVVVGSYAGNTSFGGEAMRSTEGLLGASDDIFVVSLGADTSHRFSQSFGSTGPDAGHAVARDAAGNILWGGSFAGPVAGLAGAQSCAGESDALVVKLSPAGAVVWSLGFGRQEHDLVQGVAIDGDDAVLVTGQFVDAFSLGDKVVIGKGLEDIFVAKLTP